MPKKLNRRSFLKQALTYGGYALGSSTFASILPNIAQAASSCGTNNKILIHLFLDGGLDFASLVVPRLLTPYFEKRPTIAVANSIPIGDGQYGLHPALSALATRFGANELALVLGTGPNSKPSKSHADAKMMRARGMGNIFTAADKRGWAGRFGDLYCDTKDPLALFSFKGNGPSIAAQSVDWVTTSGLSAYGYNNDSDTNDSKYRRMIMKECRNSGGPAKNPEEESVKQAWNLVDDTVSSVATLTSGYSSPITYANDGLSQRFRDCARLIKAGVNPSIILLSQGGYDTHGNEVNGLTAQFTVLNNAIGSFMADLEDMGRAQDVVILVESEFGRNTFENSGAGTDHGAGALTWLLGKRVQGGIYGGITQEEFVSKKDFNIKFAFQEPIAQALKFLDKFNPAEVLPETYPVTGLNLIK